MRPKCHIKQMFIFKQCVQHIKIINQTDCLWRDIKQEEFYSILPKGELVWVCRRWQRSSQEVGRGVPIVAQGVKNLTSIHEDVSSIPCLPQWLKDLVLPQLQHMLQMRLRSGIAVGCCGCGIVW